MASNSDTSIKLKITEVCKQVPNVSRNNVNLVLHENDLDVQKTIEDFFSGRAITILQQWNNSGPNAFKSKNKSNKKRKNKQIKEQDQKTTEIPEEGHPLQNGLHAKDNSDLKEDLTVNRVLDERTSSVVLKHMLTDQTATISQSDRNHVDSKKPSIEIDETPAQSKSSVTVEKVSVEPEANRPSEKETNMPLVHPQLTSEPNVRTLFESNTKKKQHNRKGRKEEASSGNQNQNIVKSASGTGNSVVNMKNIEKVLKELHRCTVSFERSRNLLNDEFEESSKRVKQVFEQINEVLIDREVQLFRMLDTQKEEAFAILRKRETRAKELKRRAERAASLNAVELNELRHDVKTFVSERKIDEELGKAIHFNYDEKLLSQTLPNFGELAPSRTLASRHRERYESTASDISSIPELVSHEAAVPPSVGKSQEFEATNHAPITNWADTIDNDHPLQDTRASWAVGTSLVKDTSSKSDHDWKHRGKNPKPQRDRKERQRPNMEKDADSKRDFTNPNTSNIKQSSSDDVNRNVNPPPRYNKEFKRRPQSEQAQRDQRGDNQLFETPHSPYRNQNPNRGRSNYRGGGSFRGSPRGSYQNRSFDRPRNTSASADYRNDGSTPLPPRNNQRFYRRRNPDRPSNYNQQNNPGDQMQKPAEKIKEINKDE